jgi:uncharacterized membrane protein
VEEDGVKFMTRAELVKKSEEHAKAAKRAWTPALIFLGCIAIFLLWINSHKEVISKELFGIIAVIGSYVGMLGAIVIAGKTMKKHRQNIGMVCPACKKDFIGGSLQLAIASGRCGRCGAIILEDWNK